jgi:hypothetical protein
MGGGHNSLKISAPLHLIMTYQMRPLQPDPSRWTVPLIADLPSWMNDNGKYSTNMSPCKFDPPPQKKKNIISLGNPIS